MKRKTNMDSKRRENIRRWLIDGEVMFNEEQALRDALDHIDALERDQSAREAALKLRIAERLREVGRRYFLGGHSHRAQMLEALAKETEHDATSGTSALDDLLREARLKEAEWWAESIFDKPSSRALFDEVQSRLAELRSAPRREGK